MPGRYLSLASCDMTHNWRMTLMAATSGTLRLIIGDPNTQWMKSWTGRSISLSYEACRIRQGDQPGHYRYALSVSKSKEPAAPTSGLGKKVDDAYTGAWMTVFMVVLAPFVLIGAAVSKAID